MEQGQGTCPLDSILLFLTVSFLFYCSLLFLSMKISELFLKLYGKDLCVCPECSGKMLKLPRGMPASELPPHLQSKLRAVC